MKILFVCESFSSKLSGGKVVRYMQQILTDHGHDVKVAITSPFNNADTLYEGANELITAIPSQTRFFQRMYLLTNKSLVPQQFSSLVDRFQPDIVHFASFDHAKPSNLYWYCKDRGLRIILQPWTMHFFCYQGFGFRDGHQCTLCISDGLGAAIWEGCSSLRGSLVQLERATLRRMATCSADIVLSSNNDLDVILARYGVPMHRIRRFPIPFDTTKVPSLPNTISEDYFIYYGQANDHKGTRLLIEIFTTLPEKQLHLYPMADYSLGCPLPPNIRIFPGQGWDTGLSDAIARAKAVIVPSLWNTSTEYSLCEAMSMGKPVIVFKVGVHKDILTHGKNALVIDIGDLDQFKLAIDELDNNSELRTKLSAGAVECIKEINDPKKLHAQLIDAYMEA